MVLPRCRFIDVEADASDLSSDDRSSDSDSYESSFVVEDDASLSIAPSSSDASRPPTPELIDLTVEDDGSDSSSDSEDFDGFAPEEMMNWAVNEGRTEIYSDLMRLPDDVVMDLWNAHLAMSFHYQCLISSLCSFPGHQGDLPTYGRMKNLHLVRAHSIASFLTNRGYIPWLNHVVRMIGQTPNRSSSIPNSDEDLE